MNNETMGESSKDGEKCVGGGAVLDAVLGAMVRYLGFVVGAWRMGIVSARSTIDVNEGRNGSQAISECVPAPE